MSGLESLIPYIYHEKQQPGSMLCAQHALNSLLQGNYFTAPDLSDIARALDVMEESYDNSNIGEYSTNMDDTGFFSVQVLENALKVWGLKSVSSALWHITGHELGYSNSAPYSLTRWRGEEMRPYHLDPQNQLAFILNLEQHWFTLRRFGSVNTNLDFNDGNGHWFNLNSFLPNPEWVGKLYLGLVLHQAEDEGYSVFAVTRADPKAPLALPLIEADVIAATLPEPTSPRSNAPVHITKSTRGSLETDRGTIEDNDYGLQAALQASLVGQITPSGHNCQEEDFTSPISTYVSKSRTMQLAESSRVDASGHVDPIAVSMERSRALLQQMKEQQEFAQKEMWSQSDLGPEELAAQGEQMERRRIQEEEDAQLWRAIKESEALAALGDKQLLQKRNDATDDQRIDPGTSYSLHYEEAELQAALKASLEHFSSSARPPPAEADEMDSAMSDTASEEAVSPIPSLDEIRQRRLVHFRT